MSLHFSWSVLARFGGNRGRARQSRRSQLAFEPLETRSLLATLTVDIGDPASAIPGDDLYGQMQEAVHAASKGDTIEVILDVK